MSQHTVKHKNRTIGPNTQKDTIPGIPKGKPQTGSYNLDTHSTHKTITYLLIFILPAFFMRTYALYQHYDGGLFAMDALPYYLRGYLSDFALGSAFAILSVYLLIDRRWSYVIFTAFWSLVFAGNHEHIYYNSSNTDLYFAQYGLTKEFLRGSVFVNTLFLKSLLCFLATHIILIYYQRTRGLMNLHKRLLLGVLAISVLGVFLPIHIHRSQWIQTNVIENNSREVIASILNSRAAYKDKQLDEKLLAKYFSQDLSGSERVSYPQEQPNVLLLILEGLGKQDLNQAAHLKQLAHENVFYSAFILNERQTNRGLYSLICGGYPNLISKETKSDLIGSYGSKHPCLPEILGDYGYSTVFMEGANLDFMRKDLFSKSAGYKEVYGNESAWTAYQRGGWGVDDRGLMEAVYRQILSLERKDVPWMVTVLTSGTHPRYNVPPWFYSHSGAPTWEDAVRYVDQATVRLLRQLKDKGILDSTLILITADEVARPNPGPYSQIDAANSFLIVMTPHKDRQLIDDLYMQADVPISISDYIGHGAEMPFGRSLFRQYSSKRSVLFGNVYANRIFLRDHNHRVLMCNRQFSDCATYQLEPNAGTYTPLPTIQEQVNELKIVAAYNDLTSEDLNSSVVFEERNKHYNGSSIILAHHKISAKQGETIYWRATLRAGVTTALMKVSITAFVRDGWKTVFKDDYDLTPGQLLDFNKTWQAQHDTDELLTNVLITVSGEDRYFIKDVSIHKIVNESRVTAAMNKIEISGGVVDRSINLLKYSKRTDCLGKSIVSRKAIVARECGVQIPLTSPPNLFVRKDETITARYEIKGVRGHVTLYVDFFDSENVLKKQRPIKVKSGERANIELEFRAKNEIPGLQPRIAILESSDDGEFVINSASIRIQ